MRVATRQDMVDLHMVHAHMHEEAGVSPMWSPGVKHLHKRTTPISLRPFFFNYRKQWGSGRHVLAGQRLLDGILCFGRTQAKGPVDADAEEKAREEERKFLSQKFDVILDRLDAIDRLENVQVTLTAYFQVIGACFLGLEAWAKGLEA